MKIGYARVSTSDQNLDMQIKALEAAGCEIIFEEKISANSTFRPEFNKCLNKLRTGDTLVVYKLDRLSRSLRNIISILDDLNSQKIYFHSLHENISTEGAFNELMTHIIGIFAQFEHNTIVERCQEGRRRAKERGVVFGRPKDKVCERNKHKVKQCALLYNAGSSVQNIMETLQIGRETVYRYLRKEGITPNRESRFKKVSK